MIQTIADEGTARQELDVVVNTALWMVLLTSISALLGRKSSVKAARGKVQELALPPGKDDDLDQGNEQQLQNRFRHSSLPINLAQNDVQGSDDRYKIGDQ